MTGSLMFRSNNLHRVTVVQHSVKGHNFTIDPGTHTVEAYFGMDLKGHIHRRSSNRQLDEIALGRENKYLVVEQVNPEEFQKLLRSGLFILHYFHQLPQPADLAVHRSDVPVVVFLIAPVGRHPDLGGLIHLLGPYLNLHHFPGGAYHGGMDGLIAVQLGGGDEILETLLNGSIELVNNPQSGVAFIHAINNNTDSQQVVNFLEVDPAALHLAPYGIVMLGPA
ncbi:hypothetical protein ES703_99482 [subsurface metagenome]